MPISHKEKYRNCKTDVRPVFPQNNLWFNVGRKQTVISRFDLKDWFEAVMALKGKTPDSKADVVRDYLLFILFTGMRRTETATLKWECVNFKSKTFRVPDTKNKKGHELPLSDFLLDLLKARKSKCHTSPYVFPGKSKNGYIVEPKRWVKEVCETSGVKFSPHDLRRTFATIAESVDIPAYSLKMLLNHSVQKSDVTAGYLIISTERLRKPMQTITDTILKYAGVKKGGEVINLKNKYFQQ